METEATCWGAPGQRTSGSQLWEPDHPQASRPGRIRPPLGAGCWQRLCRVMGVPLPETGSPLFWHHPSRLECEGIPCPAGPTESQKGAEPGTFHRVTPQGKSLGVVGGHRGQETRAAMETSEEGTISPASLLARSHSPSRSHPTCETGHHGPPSTSQVIANGGGDRVRDWTGNGGQASSVWPWTESRGLQVR